MGHIDHIHEEFSTDCITTGDFNTIVRAALPDADEGVLNFIRIESGVRLRKLYEIIKRIDDEKKNNNGFVLNINTLAKICNQYNFL